VCIPEAESRAIAQNWINGKPVESNRDQLERLRVIAGEVKPYVLDISWEDATGNQGFSDTDRALIRS